MRFIRSFVKCGSVCVLLASLSACTLDFFLPTGEPTRLAIYKDGRLVDEKLLGAADPTRLAVTRWLAANRDGWNYAFVTRPQRFNLKGKDFFVNVAEAEVSVKYCRGFFNCHLWVKNDSGLFLEVERTLTAPLGHR